MMANSRPTPPLRFRQREIETGGAKDLGMLNNLISLLKQGRFGAQLQLHPASGVDMNVHYGPMWVGV